MPLLKKILTTTPILSSLFEICNRIRLTGTIFVSVLPANKKVEALLSYANRYQCKIFIETGTFRGDTVKACSDYFETLYSIELSNKYFLESSSRFANVEKVHILEGNSGEILPSIIKKEESTLYWLDAHYSLGETAKGDKDTPIIKELTYILDNDCKGCVLIDDARCFNGKAGYPRISTLRKIIHERNIASRYQELSLTVRNDIIRIVRV